MNFSIFFELPNGKLLPYGHGMYMCLYSIAVCNKKKRKWVVSESVLVLVWSSINCVKLNFQLQIFLWLSSWEWPCDAGSDEICV